MVSGDGVLQCQLDSPGWEAGVQGVFCKPARPGRRPGPDAREGAEPDARRAWLLEALTHLLFDLSQVFCTEQLENGPQSLQTQ